MPRAESATAGSVLPSAPPAYLPYAEARRQAHIIVDGAALPTTVLTLSHWPNNTSPPEVRRDTSTATVFAWLDTPALYCAVPWASNNHFDEDGLFSLYALTAPADARRHRELLIDGSWAGDFGVVRSRAAARLCFAVEALTDPASATLPVDGLTADERVTAQYQLMLERLPGLLADLPAHEHLWGPQDAVYAAGEALHSAGRVRVEEHPDPALDLAIVHLAEDLQPVPVRRYLENETALVHPFIVNTATARSRLLRVRGRHYELEYRYEGWLRLASRRVALRVRLDALVERLNTLDGGGWVADDPLAITPRLRRPDGTPSSLDLERFLAELVEGLRNGPVAWDPYDWRTPSPQD